LTIFPGVDAPASFDHAMLREIAKHPRTTPKTLQASVNMLNVKVHDSTMSKTQPRLSKKNMSAHKVTCKYPFET